VEYESGDIGVLVFNWGLPTPKSNKPSLMANSIIGSEGFVMPKETQDSNGLKVFCGGEEVIVNPEPEDEPDCIDAELGVYNHFIDEIEGRGKVQASVEEGILSLACTMASIRSGVLGRAVKVSEMIEAKPTVLDCMK
jgi:predicted dehydrogenase